MCRKFTKQSGIEVSKQNFAKTQITWLFFGRKLWIESLNFHLRTKKMAGIFSPFHFNVLDGVKGPPNGTTTSNVCVTYHDTSLRFFFLLRGRQEREIIPER